MIDRDDSHGAELVGVLAEAWVMHVEHSIALVTCGNKGVKESNEREREERGHFTSEQNPMGTRAHIGNQTYLGPLFLSFSLLFNPLPHRNVFHSTYECLLSTYFCSFLRSKNKGKKRPWHAATPEAATLSDTRS